jgi:hypothetical protein
MIFVQNLAQASIERPKLASDDEAGFRLKKESDDEGGVPKEVSSRLCIGALGIETLETDCTREGRERMKDTSVAYCRTRRPLRQGVGVNAWNHSVDRRLDEPAGRFHLTHANQR